MNLNKHNSHLTIRIKIIFKIKQFKIIKMDNLKISNYKNK